MANLTVRTPRTGRPPVAVVLLFGWYMTPIWVLTDKYASMYESRGCATISGTVGPCVSLKDSDRHYDEFVLEAIHHAADILRKNPGIPLLIHCFSNTGCRALHRMELKLEAAYRTLHGSKSSNPDIAWVKERMEAQIFDSAPATVSKKGNPFYSMCCSWRAASPHACIWVNLFGKICDGVDKIKAVLTCKKAPEVEYWDHIASSNMCNKQAFLYSDSDDLCDAGKLEELIETRRRKGVDVLAVQFHGSNHVNHLQQHRAEYESAINTMLKRAEFSLNSWTLTERNEGLKHGILGIE